MKLRAIGFLVVLAMAMGVVALPAAADVSVGPHAGVFVGSADVGKSGVCNNDGTGSVDGGGIGLLPLDVKNAWYRIDAPLGSVVDVPNGLGALKLCGHLTAPLQDTPVPVPCEPLDLEDPTCTEQQPLDIKELGLGASCAATKGWGGQGKATFPSKSTEKWLSNLGWKATLGGTFVVTADVGGVKGKKQDLLIATVQTLSELVLVGCVNKTVLEDKANPDPFTVVAAYTIIPGAGCDKTDCDKKEPKKS